jgi:hypothetical protein
MDIVIARYNEKLDWIKNIPEEFNKIIYNKGPPLPSEYNSIPLENIGREGHTYYKYIYDNYENLPDHVVFLQGYPFDHSPNLINVLNKYRTEANRPIGFEYISDHFVNCNLSGCRYNRKAPLRDVYEALFGKRIENMPFRFAVGAQFIVSKEQILKRSREFYLKIVEMLSYSVNPIEGHVIERFQSLIFSDNV